MTDPTRPLFQRDPFTWLAYGMLAYYAYVQAALGPLMPFLQGELGLSYTVAGLHLSAFALGMILAGLLGDRIARRWGRTVTFWGGALGMASGAVFLALSRQVPMTIAGTLVMGTLGSLLVVMIQATLSDHHGPLRAVALTESNVVAMAAATLAPLALGTFQHLGIGWRGALYLAAVVAVAAIVGWRGLALPAGRPRRRPGDVKDAPLPQAFWSYWAVIILVVSVEWCLVFWGAGFLEQVVGLDRVAAATTMSLFFGAGVLGRFLGSRLTRTLAPAILLMAAVGISLAGFPLLWLAPSPWLNLAGLFLAGLGVANLFPLTLSLAIGAAQSQADAASARVALGAGVAIFSAPLLVGWIADQLSIREALGVVGILLILSTLAIILANRLAGSPRPAHGK